MAETSSIEWTDATVNFWWGCTKVGPGCDHCYAETWANRFGMKLWAADAPRRPIEGAAAMLRKLDRGHKRFISEHGRRRRVFMQSMSDLFDNAVDPHLRRAALDESECATRLDIIFLTKRVSNVANMIPDHWMADCWPRHIGLMITVVNQQEANRDISRLLHLKSWLGIPWVGLSIEPMLDHIDLTPWLAHIDWVIAGGESGRKARQMQASWLRALRDQCADSDIPFFFKQWGDYYPKSDDSSLGFSRSGKKAADRLLDRRTHDEFWRSPR
jgi:protein gp37